MTPEQQSMLGFNQMLAALKGGHNLRDAFIEIASMMGSGQRPFVITGGMGFLLQCTDAIQQAGYPLTIPDPDLNDFIQSTDTGRLNACAAAVSAGDHSALFRFVATLIACIEPHRDLIFFAENLPRVAPIKPSTGH